MNNNTNTITTTTDPAAIGAARYAAARMIALFRNDEATMTEILTAFILREAALREIES
jgi:hypothetical protein